MKKFLFLFFILGVLTSNAAGNGDIESMVEALLNKMTLEEKVRLSYAQSKFSSPGVARLGVPELYSSDGPHGVRMEICWDSWEHAGWTNDSCTAFPALTCLAATWQPELANLYGRMIGEEARYRKKNVLLGPGVNLYRTPLNGRNFEYMGEDPYLTSRMCVPYIQGLQSNGVACCVKHYALNEQEAFRNHVDVRVSDRALYELYLRPFHAAVVEGGAWSVMGSYNQYLNQHATHNARLINDILKKEWGFDGAVITDWGAAHNTDEAIFNGLDLEMGSFTDGLTAEAPINSYDDYYLGRAYLEKCRRGEVPDSIINDKARRMLRLILRTAMAGNYGCGSMNSPEHVAAARKIAQEGIVLLKNNGILPIVPKDNMKILVVGENATRSLCAGGGSSELKPRDEVSPLRGIKERFGDKCTIEYAKGYASGRTMYGKVDVLPQSLYDSLRNEAVEKAKTADYVIYVGGLNKNHKQDCEGGDRESYQLPFGQDRLITELLAANRNTVLVIVSGNAYDTPWIDKAPALVQSWYLGSEAGHALADIISGDVCPSGKLPFSFAYKLNDYPAHKMGAVGYPGVSPDKLPQPFGGEEGKPLNSAELLKAAVKGWKGIDFCALPGDGTKKDETEVYGEDILLGYRWFDYFKTKVRFPFGFGLSYTTFSYGKPTVKGRMVSVTVRNSGRVAGQEVVQFYVGDDKASVIRPVKELKHFEKVALEPGETKQVSYTIDDDDLKYFDEVRHEWVAERGAFTVYVGSSATDIHGKVKFNY
ncbi:glycoside hydrolase family 3 C-terminal domain-containing protein [uncultured Prevotella sp.]|uniref:glycoside hydrolase family 3 C-terminal domain-containing protein n=1 Tax=uncultured Prevotella sp. TaxID=159272 RepID=UPI0025F83A97|nr:glycoside hydrolase family 3 C-terminal domain-containing protein [uncultured Prevotella sp.]